MNPLWTLIPHKGIENESLKIHLGMGRSSVKDLLAGEFRSPRSNVENEEDFQHPTDGTLIRLRYANSMVQDIEVLGGQLDYEGVAVFGGDAVWPDIEHFLKAQGVTIREAQWLGEGYDCLELSLNIATHEQAGRDDDEGIEWVILSTLFTN